MTTPTSLVGKTLGGFLIQGQLGSGGMGVVYRAHDDRLNRNVAIKVLHPKYMADDLVRQRFIREGRTAALIDHPNVVRVLAAGEDDGIPYLVTEYVEGGTLNDLLDGGESLTPARCLRIGKQLAEALAAAHRVGVMHRDVKPANVLFTHDGEPKLADFGLAREESGDRALSQTGIVLGTPHYMAPEACQGGQGDARSDIYSLGVVLYAMMEKRLPFPGDTQARILVAQIQDPVPPLTKTPLALKRVICRALEKKPSDRWSSASDFAAALERVLEEIHFPASPGTGAATSSPGATTFRAPANAPPVVPSGGAAVGGPSALPGRKWSGRRRGLLVISSAAVVLIVAALLAPSFRRRRRALPPAPAGETAAMAPAAGPAAVSAPNIIPADPVPPVPTLSPEPHDVVEIWEADFQRISRESEALETAGEYRRAFGAWSEFQPPNTRAREELDRARAELLGRSAARVERELSLKPRGAKAAADLRALAARIPQEKSLPLLAAATEAEKGWSPADGFAGLQSGFARHDPASLQAEIGAAGAGETAGDRAGIASARIAALRLGLLLDRAFAWYRTRRGTELDIQRTNGPAAHGTIQAVDETAHHLYVENAGSLANLSAADLASRELVARALEDNPPDEVLLAALDLFLLAGESREAWPVALRARRRGLAIEPDREALLAAQVPPEDLAAAKAALRELADLRSDPARLRAASRDWLRKYRALPLDPADLASAREALRREGGVASAEDLELFCSARVTGHGKSFSLDYGVPEALLADFEATGPVQVEPGELAALRPAGIPAVQLLKGLAWKEGVIEMRLRTSSRFTVLTGWRSPGEHFEFVLSPAREGRIAVTLPICGMSFEAPPLEDGWIDLRFAWAPGEIVVRVNGTTRECPLPRDWSGEIGFAPGGAWSWRSLQVYGQADFEPPASAGEIVAAPQERRSLKASWGTWASPISTQNELLIVPGGALEWVVPKSWEAGNNYRVAFGMRVSAGAAAAFDFGVGEGRRRVILGAGGESGFVVGGDLFRSGPAPALPTEGDVAVEIVVHRGRVWISLDGKGVWSGCLNASNKGGLAVGASGGQVKFKDLKVSELEP